MRRIPRPCPALVLQQRPDALQYIPRPVQPNNEDLVLGCLEGINNQGTRLRNRVTLSIGGDAGGEFLVEGISPLCPK